MLPVGGICSRTGLAHGLAQPAYAAGLDLARRPQKHRLTAADSRVRMVVLRVVPVPDGCSAAAAALGTRWPMQALPCLAVQKDTA